MPVITGTNSNSPLRPHLCPHYLSGVGMSALLGSLAQGLPPRSRPPGCCSSRKGSGPGCEDAAPGCGRAPCLPRGPGSRPHTPCTAPARCLPGCSPPETPAPKTPAAWAPQSHHCPPPAGWAWAVGSFPAGPLRRRGGEGVISRGAHTSKREQGSPSLVACARKDLSHLVSLFSLLWSPQETSHNKHS